jgi:nitroimidazol reductase NimA-like FMN-containing flavoprotein (pyridoxamine 5'-phosphate oxidase superfamily)
LARGGSSHPTIGTQLALGVSVKVTRKVIRDRTCRKHEKHWQSMCRQGRVRALSKTIYRRSLRTAQSEQKPAKSNKRTWSFKRTFV